MSARAHINKPSLFFLHFLIAPIYRPFPPLTSNCNKVRVQGGGRIILIYALYVVAGGQSRWFLGIGFYHFILFVGGGSSSLMAAMALTSTPHHQAGQMGLPGASHFSFPVAEGTSYISETTQLGCEKRVFKANWSRCFTTCLCVIGERGDDAVVLFTQMVSDARADSSKGHKTSDFHLCCVDSILVYAISLTGVHSIQHRPKSNCVCFTLLNLTWRVTTVQMSVVIKPFFSTTLSI